MWNINVWLIAYSAILVVLYVVSLYIPADEVIPVLKCSETSEAVATAVLCVKDAADATITLISDVNKLVSSFDVAVLGAGAALSVNGRKWSGHWSIVDSGLVTGVFVCATASLYGVYLSYMALLSLIPHSVLNPFDIRLEWSLTISYNGLVLAVVLLGVIFLRFLAFGGETGVVRNGH